MTGRTWLLLALLPVTACVGPEGEGLLPTPDGTGPRVIWDSKVKPLPDLPLPNNAATRLDPTSPTGRRINLSLQASTQAESLVRSKANTMDGFGTFSPVWVSFDKALDVEKFRDDMLDEDPNNDPVYLINIDHNSDEFGRVMPLEAGQGNYPLGLEWPWQYWDFDEHADSNNMLFETHDEDTNNNKELDPYEDIDFDGVLDKPNTWDSKDPGPNAIDTLIPFYDKQTNSLVLWPVVPLKQKTTYAVVLTDRLVGEDGQPVRSPFPYVNHLNQTDDLAALAETLPAVGSSVNNVAFTWTFTTQTITDELVAIRKGLYGAGPLGWLANDYAPQIAPKQAMSTDEYGDPVENTLILPQDVFDSLLTIAGNALYPDKVVSGIVDDLEAVDYWVMGTFQAPNFLADQEGYADALAGHDAEARSKYPCDDNESFLIDLDKGTASVETQTVSFICSIPKKTDKFQAPFPVMTYGHGYSGAPFEVFGFAGRMAHFGWAFCGLDAPGHGLALPVEEGMDWNQMINGILDSYLPQLKTFFVNFQGGRIRDLDNDGVVSAFDNGGDFWSWDIFHMRDMVRQGVIDHIQFIKTLRSLGGENPLQWDTDGDGTADGIAGDYNKDGVPDFGTAKNIRYPVWGQSMGAIISQVLVGVEPAVESSTPVSGGGGLIHVGIRCTNPGVPEAVLLPMLGPLMVFSPTSDGKIEIAWMINHLHEEYPRAVKDKERAYPREHYYPFARTDQIEPGDTVFVTNVTNGEVRRSFRRPLPEGETEVGTCKEDSSSDAYGECIKEKANCQQFIANWDKPECAKWHGWRISIPCDAADTMTRRLLLGLKAGDTEPVPVSCGVDPTTGTADWYVEIDEDGNPIDDATCDSPKPELATLFGDEIRIDIYRGWVEEQNGKMMRLKSDGSWESAEPKAVIDTFGSNGEGDAWENYNPLVYLGAKYPAETPLIALGTGYGRARNTPDFRKLMSVAAFIVEKGDPIGYAPHYAKRLDCGCGYDDGICPEGTCLHPSANVILYHSIGDPNVPVSTDMSLARAAGILDYEGPDSRNSILLRAHANEGVEKYRRHLSSKITYTDWLNDPKPGATTHYLIKDPRWMEEFEVDAAETPGGWMPLHADIDNQDAGIDEFGEPAVEGYTPVSVQTEDGGIRALRFPYTKSLGSHGVEPSDPRHDFNINNFVVNQMAVFMTDGKLYDSPCLSNSSCAFLPESVRASESVHTTGVALPE